MSSTFNPDITPAQAQPTAPLSSPSITPITTSAGDSLAKSVAPAFQAINPSALEQPQLPSVPSQNLDALMLLAKGFAAVFAAAASTSMAAMEGVQQTQQFNQIVAGVVLKQTNESIQKQQEAYKKYEKVMALQNNPFTKIFGYVIMAIMAVVMVATIVSGFFTGGATDAALVPEAEAMASMAAEGGGAAALTGADAGAAATEVTSAVTEGAAESASTAADAGTAAAPEATTAGLSDEVAEAVTEQTIKGITEESVEEGAGETTATASSVASQNVGVADQALDVAESTTAQTATNAEAAGEESVSNVDTEVQESASNAGKETAAEQATSKTASKAVSRWLIRFTSGFVGAIPQLISGIQSLKLADMLRTYANMQKQIGDVSAQQSLEQSLYTFFQNSSGREVEATTSATEGTTTASQDFAALMDAYTQAVSMCRNAQAG